MHKKNQPPIRVRIAQLVAGKSFIPSLPSVGYGAGAARINEYRDKASQLQANLGWVSAANEAIVSSVAAVELVLYKKLPDGDKERVHEHEILDLLNQPNSIHGYEQFVQLHHTYVNITGEGYILLLDKNGQPFEPRMGRLPAALHLLPSHEASIQLRNDDYYNSQVMYKGTAYPIGTVIRDLVPDPMRPYYGRSVIAASASSIDTDEQMKEWNRNFFANEARPGMVFTTNEELSDASYERLNQQIKDMHTGTTNAYKPLLLENGTVQPYMLNQKDLDFMNSRAFSRDEILAMMRVSPSLLGMVENVNKANMEGALDIHALINTIPRMRRFVTLLNNQLVKPFDRTLELGFISPLSDDKKQKLEEAKAGVNAWMTIDEVRDMYGMEALPSGAGEQLYVQGIVTPLEVLANPPAPAKPSEADPNTAKSLEGEHGRPKPRS